MKIRVGIEALSIAVPHRFLALEDLARARNVEPAKYIAGLGVSQMAVAEPGEDTVALAATAAARLIKNESLDPQRIGMLIVGTETGVDHSKPVASFVQGLLKLPASMRTFDTQHACYGGTAGLMAATEWIVSGSAKGKVAIVICSDIARYGLNTAGEPTQGGGAVAMLISDNPELLELDFGVNGTHASNVHDFWRPIGHREAQVDGHYSMQCYLDALQGSYRSWKANAAAKEILRPDGTLPSEQLAKIAYHVPFCKMAKKAHLHVRRVDTEDKLGHAWTPELEAEEKPRSEASFKRQVEPTLSLCSKVGNVYTASLYLSLAGLLESEGDAIAGKRIGMFSYGSGSSSEFFSGVVGPRAGAKVRALGLSALLESRERVSMEEYERIFNHPPSEPISTHAAPGTFRFVGVENHRRTYQEG